MSKSARKKRGSSPTSSKGSSSAAAGGLPINHRRRGMPSVNSIVGVEPLGTGVAEAAATFGAVGKTSKYQILVTNQVDAYEKVPSQSQGLNLILAAAAAAPPSDLYVGKDRKAAKLSIPDAKTEEFKDLKDLIKSLTPDKVMKNRVPKITTGPTSDRVAEEKRNIRVRAFLYAASREKDNDFHLIIGRDPDKGPEMYMTMEISGLPPANNAAFKKSLPKLKAARNAYKKFFKDNLPGLGYEFPDPPIPVEIEGSLFFDMTHATGSKPGPKDLRPHIPTIWEIHPITKIEFEP
jgi:hypothetical protein